MRRSMQNFQLPVCGIHADAPPSDRKGSVLLVVIGLLGMLLLLGVAFYSFASQEITSSQYYAEAAKEEAGGLSPEKLWEYALEQLIVGTTDNAKAHSALWGSRHALLTGILGRTGAAGYDGFDPTPFNGLGINLQYSTSMGSVGDPYVDQDFDGSPDGSQSLLNINYSPAANGGSIPTVPTSPAPDVDYTAPDINSLPLAFVGSGVDINGADVSVIIPSFHRPQLLRQSGAIIPNWPQSNVTTQRVMRPHPYHMTATANPIPRFISAITGPVTNSLGQTVQPFPFGTNASVQQGVWDLTGPPGAAAPNYQWDVDNDGDLVKEGIWMDLDFPMQSLPDGRNYVPLFSFTVTDADGLINLNISGNQSGLSYPVTGLPLAGGRHISRSNQGLSRAEISPEWAMTADPAIDSASTLQHNLFWNTGAGTISRTEMANSETLFLNMGRPDFTDRNGGTYSVPGGGATTYEPTSYYAGRYGELELMARNNYTMSGKGIASYGDGSAANRDFSFMPLPGRSGQIYSGSGDDDLDAQFGQSRFDNAGYYFMGASFQRLQSNVAVPSFVHPLDFWGNGASFQAISTGLRVQMSNSGLTVPSQWPYYATGYSSPGNDSTMSGFTNYLSAASGNLLPSSILYQSDEPDEIISEWELASTNATMLQDEVFGPDNMFELQATNSDLANAKIEARVRDLAPFNFRLNARADAVRSQFTVLSHDRKNFGAGPYVRRIWEFNADSNNDGHLEFPPAFVSPLGNAANEPFRQALRQLLFMEQNPLNTSSTLTQLRLNLNRLLAGYDTTTSGTPITAPVYRELTAHPAPTVTIPNTPLTSPSWNANSPSGSPSPNDQEYWARYDRQLMARDIYVLLYTLGGGMDTTPYTTTNAANQLYTNAQLKEMAQFAVNVVDELDRDDVITKFEYDKNLGDGWSLDDNAYNAIGDPETTNVDRAVVYGVEAQTLTLSELLGIISRRVDDGAGNTPPTYQDHKATQVNDSEGAADRFYTYMELRNASPFNVDLSSGAWQIAVQDDPDGTPNTGDETDRVQLTLLSGNSTSVITPGGLFTIGTRGGPPALDPASMNTKNFPSLFRVETTGAATPDFTTAATLIAPLSTTLDLDLIPQTAGANNDTTKFRLTNGSASSTVVGAGADVTTAGNFLFGGPGGNVSLAQETGTPHTFVLRRRANPRRTMPVSYSSNAADHTSQSVDNPWVEVDRLVMPTWREFKLSKNDGATEVQAALVGLRSKERAQPFSRNLAEADHVTATGAPGAAPVAYQAHTLQGYNSNSPLSGSFTQLQLHFDRDFASPIDLLSIPLYGPDEVTRRVGQTTKFDNSATGQASFLAQERFLRPQHYDNLTGGIPAATVPTAATAVSDIKNNRWYRILELLEVPTQTEQNMRVYPYAIRTSGAINLNTLRTRGVLAGVIDDPDNPTTGVIDGHHTPQYASEAAMLVDQFEPSGTYARDWWLQFLASRDGVDPLTGLILPGTPQGRPFRSMTYAERSSASLEDTILRSLPLDVIAAQNAGSLPQQSDRRTLFEARTISDRPQITPGGGDLVDPVSKHRLLRKVANNTTTRSNVFIVWISTRFFEAVEQPNGVQIGAQLDGTQDHRGFFIIDRSLPESAYDSNTGKFDFRKFVQYRKTIQ